jgi:predicted HTH transcriptional regulator
VVHRDFSLTGKDIKVAIYDDMVEITSPGLLPPSIDYSAMESRQSDVRNKIIAPVFKRLGIIDQWGNGLKLIADEMKDFPDIELRWKEVGMSFQIQFVCKDWVADVGDDGSNGSNDGGNGGNNGGVGGNVGNDVGNDVGNVGNEIEVKLIDLIHQNKNISAKELSEILNISSRHCERIIADLKEKGKLSRIGKTRGYWVVND